MDIFKLFGTIAIENDKANKSIDDTTDKAEMSSGKIKTAFSKIHQLLEEAFKSDKPKSFGVSLNELANKIDNQKTKLTVLKDRYKDLYLTQGKNSEEAEKCAKEINKLSAELKENEQALKKAETAADGFDNSLDDVSKNADSSGNSMIDTFKKIGGAIATYFAADKIISFGKEIVNVAAEVSAETSAFEQIMGDYSDDASKKVSKIAEATGMVDSRLTPYMTSMTAKFKGLGYDVSDATDYASRGLNLAADASAFWDKSLDESMSHLNSFINGSYEGGEAIGLFANDTQMAAYAVETGLVSETKAWSALDEATKQATRLEYAENMMKKSGATGQAAKEAGQYANVQANLNEKWRQFKAQIGEPLLENIVIPAMSKLSGIIDKLSPAFEKLVNWCKEHKTTLENLGIVLGVATGAFIAFKIAMGISSLITTVKKALDGMTVSQWLLNAAMNANPIMWVVMAIAALVAGILLLWKNCDGFREAVIGMWNKIKGIFSDVGPFFNGCVDKVKNAFANVKEIMSKPFTAAKEAISKVVDNIKSIFSNLKFKFPSIKLPHFSVNPKGWKIGDLLKGEIPKLGIEWYARAMNNPLLLDKPTIFGYDAASGNLLGGGEKGTEVVTGANTLMGMISGAVASQMSEHNDKLLTVLTAILEAIINGNSEMLKALLDGQKVVVGEREFARLVRKYA